MAEIFSTIQERMKSSTANFLLLLLKLITALMVGLTLSLILMELIGFGTFSFILVIAVVALALLRVMKYWSWGRVLIFDLICVLVALLLRMYILIAPGV
jgi:hypothetical protein